MYARITIMPAMAKIVIVNAKKFIRSVIMLIQHSCEKNNCDTHCYYSQEYDHWFYPSYQFMNKKTNAITDTIIINVPNILVYSSPKFVIANSDHSVGRHIPLRINFKIMIMGRVLSGIISTI